MIKTISACTSEVDDKKLAVQQILAQLSPETNLQKNAIGIVACHYEFVLSGVFKAISESLPFEVVGTISTNQSTIGETDALLFSIFVITSDELRFVKTITPSLQTDPGEVLKQSYLEAAGNEKPSLILSFAPYIMQNSGDDYVNAITEASGGVPCFGTIAIDDTLDFSNCLMLANGEDYRDNLAMVLIYGNIKPKFFVAHVSDGKILEKSALITKSAGPVLMEVNEQPIIKYFEDLGLVQASETQYALTSLPFLLDYNDGTPKVSRIFIMLTPERYALCGGLMPEGSTLYIANVDKEDILLTADQVVNQILAEVNEASGVLFYSCVGRAMTLGAEQFLEMNLINERVGANIPYLMATSGGEICPTQVSGDKAINRFHNDALIACLF